MSLLDSRGFSIANLFRHSFANNIKALAGLGIFCFPGAGSPTTMLFDFRPLEDTPTGLVANSDSPRCNCTSTKLPTAARWTFGSIQIVFFLVVEFPDALAAFSVNIPINWLRFVWWIRVREKESVWDWWSVTIAEIEVEFSEPEDINFSREDDIVFVPEKE